jgi:hypothetical protein
MVMKSASLIVFVLSTLLFAQNTKAASTDTAFDGNWWVTVDYHQYKNADGSTALAAIKYFPVKVKMGPARGDRNQRGGRLV